MAEPLHCSIQYARFAYTSLQRTSKDDEGGWGVTASSFCMLSRSICPTRDQGKSRDEKDRKHGILVDQLRNEKTNACLHPTTWE